MAKTTERVRSGSQAQHLPEAKRGKAGLNSSDAVYKPQNKPGRDRPRRSTTDAEPEFSAINEPPLIPESSPPKSYTVLVADDHALVREGLVALINRQRGMRVVAEASNGREAVEKFLAQRPDVALLDLRMPVMDGIEAAAAVCENMPPARVVILTSYQTEEDVYRAMRVGVQGYVWKDAPAEELVRCIQAVASGKTWIPPAVGAQLARRVTEQSLTPREMDVLRVLALGKSNKEIGTTFNISEDTVKVHVTHILEKLKVTGRTEAMNVAIKRGLIRVDPPSGF